MIDSRVEGKLGVMMLLESVPRNGLTQAEIESAKEAAVVISNAAVGVMMSSSPLRAVELLRAASYMTSLALTMDGGSLLSGQVRERIVELSKALNRVSADKPETVQ
jgi:hypothetical protein